MGIPSLVAAKLAAPVTPQGFLHRERLYRRLDEGLAAPLTVVAAPAGVGKSALVAGWSASRRDTLDRAWVNADAGDTEARLAQHLVSAIEGDHRAVDIRGALRADLHRPRPRPLVVVIDDVHLIRSHRALDALWRLAEEAPAVVHLVLVGRAAPPVRGPWAQDDGVVHLGERELSLTAEEADLIVAAHPTLDLPAAVRSDLIDRVDGWAAGLQLALTCLAASDDPAGAAAAFGAATPAVAEYLVDEVLAQLDDERRAVLVTASVLDEWSVEGCRAVTGRADAYDLLSTLAAHNVLIGRYSDGAFRCHHLLRDLLRLRLRTTDGQRYRRLQHVVSRRAEAQGDLVGAVTHLIEAQTPQAVLELCGRHAPELATSGAGLVLRHRMGELPVPAFPDPDDELALAEVQLQAGDAAGCARRLERWPRRGHAAQQARVASLRGRCHHLLGDPEAAALHAREAHDLLAAAGRPTSAVAVDEAFGLLWEGRLTEAARTLRRAPADDAVAMGLAARVAAETGELDRAEALADAVLGPCAADRLGAPGPGTLHALVARAQVLVERADGDAAVGAIDDLLAVAHLLGTASALVVGGELRARLRWTDIGVAAGLGALDRMPGRSRGRPVGPALQGRLDRIEARLRIEAGHTDEAEALLAGRGGPAADILRARLAARCGRVGQALDVLDRLDLAPPGDHLAVEVARARTRVLADDGAPEAVPMAARLLGHRTAPAQVRRLLEEGEAVRLALAAVPGTGAALAAVLGGLERSARATMLSERELDILGYLPTRLTSQEIGDQLYISTNTVKTHLKNVYRRLDVSRRDDAVVRARELGLVG